MLQKVPGYNVVTDEIKSKTTKNSYVKYNGGFVQPAVTTSSATLTLDNQHDVYIFTNTSSNITVTVSNTINDYTSNSNNKSKRNICLRFDATSSSADRTLTLSIPNTFSIVNGSTTRKIIKGKVNTFYLEIINNTISYADNNTSYDMRLPYVFSNVAEMKAATSLYVGASCMTEGYYEAGDGGASFYSIRADNNDTDDGGSIIILDNGNVAELITDGTVNVNQFGAYGDSVHDDYVAFSNAFAFAYNRGCKVNIINKTYNLSKAIITDVSYIGNNKGVFTNCGVVYSDKNKNNMLNLSLEGFAMYPPTKYVNPTSTVSYWLQSAGYNPVRDSVLLTFAGYTIATGQNDQPGKVVEVTSDYSTILQTADIDVGHGNGTCYCPDDNSWYIATGGIGTYTGLLVLDADDLSYKGNVITGTGYWTVAYDETNKLFYVQSGHTGADRGAKIHVFDSSWNELHNVAIERVPNRTKTGYMTSQDATLVNGQYAFLFYDSANISISFYDNTTGNITNQVLFTNFNNEEPEGLYIKDNYLYIVSAGGWGINVQRCLLNNNTVSALSGMNMFLPADQESCKVIPNGADLDDYVAYGMFKSSNSGVSASLLNSPVSNAGFTLYVSRVGYERIQQIIIDNVGRIFKRNGYLNTSPYTFLPWIGDVICKGHQYDLTWNIYIGHVTNGGTQIDVFMPIGNSSERVSNVSIDSGNITIRGINGYMNPSASAGDPITDIGTVNVSKKGNGVALVMTNCTLSNVANANNTPVSVFFNSGLLKFS